MTITIRGFGDGRLVFEELVDVNGVDLRALAVIHASRIMGYAKHMLEVEFPEAPLEERFLRFGTDPSMMVEPVKVDLQN
jgi:hypothetical protein